MLGSLLDSEQLRAISNATESPTKLPKLRSMFSSLALEGRMLDDPKQDLGSLP